MSAPVPGLDIEPEGIERNAAQLRLFGQQVFDLSLTCHQQWRRLAEGYHAPETDQLVGYVERKVVPPAADVRDGAEGVARALEQFADRVDWVVSQLRAEAANPLTAVNDERLQELLHQLAQLELACANKIRAAVQAPLVDLAQVPGPRTDPGAGGSIEDALNMIRDLVNDALPGPLELPELPDGEFDGPPLPVPEDGGKVETGDGIAPLPQPVVPVTEPRISG
jgi:hypothetical protein